MLGSLHSRADILRIGSILSFYVIAHGFLFFTFVKTAVFSARLHLCLAVVTTISMLVLPLALIARVWGLGGALPQYPAWVMGWSCVVGFMSLLGLIVQILRLLLRPIISTQRLRPERRLFLERSLTLGITAGGMGLAAKSVVNAKMRPQIVQIDVPIRHLPKSFQGFRIVQLSDLHICPMLGDTYLAQVIADTLATQPDLIALTGDIIDGPSQALIPMTLPLKQLNAPYGVFAVTGNHEYYFDANHWCQHFTTLGIHVLRNTCHKIDKQGAVINLVGIDDLTGWHYGHGHGPNLDLALKNQHPAAATVLLAHQPRMMYQAAKHNIDLMLSGHTHGGQIFPFGLLARLSQPYLKGLHYYQRTWVYVSSGTGFVGPPMRLGTKAEITCITLTAT